MKGYDYSIEGRPWVNQVYDDWEKIMDSPYYGKEKGMRDSIERDAYRFMEAKLDYGKGSGTKRKLMKAELDAKMQDDSYKAAFNDALINIDTDEILRKIERRKAIERTYNGAKSTVRTIERNVNFYSRNEGWIRKWMCVLYDIFFGGNKNG